METGHCHGAPPPAIAVVVKQMESGYFHGQLNSAHHSTSAGLVREALEQKKVAFYGIFPKSEVVGVRGFRKKLIFKPPDSG